MKRPVPTAATGASTNIATLPHLLNRLAGTKFNVILGYTSSSMRVALESGEVESICGLAYSVWIVSNPDWFAQKRLNVLAQFGLKKIKELPDAPLAVDFVKNAKDKEVFALIDIVQRMGQPYVAPPDVPKERLEALRKAFDQTMEDPEFLEDSARMHQGVDPLTGGEMEQLIAGAFALPSDVIARYAELMSSVPAQAKKN
jgi:tripartite-type tricarboxylate transporter receptor subunit TctC